jgi:hypothetical protein
MVAFDCPGCGGQLTLRAPDVSEVIVCSSCGSALDAKDPRHQRLAQYKKRLKDADPKIPLGRRGEFDGVQWEAIGYMQRRVLYYGVSYRWSEYLLYNPYRGFRWLIESDGHWVLAETLANPPGERR